MKGEKEADLTEEEFILIKKLIEVSEKHNLYASEEELFDSLCNRWDQNIEVDTLNQVSLNLQASKFDNFVATKKLINVLTNFDEGSNRIIIIKSSNHQSVCKISSQKLSISIIE